MVPFYAVSYVTLGGPLRCLSRIAHSCLEMYPGGLAEPRAQRATGVAAVEEMVG